MIHRSRFGKEQSKRLRSARSFVSGGLGGGCVDCALFPLRQINVCSQITSRARVMFMLNWSKNGEKGGELVIGIDGCLQ